MPNRKIEQVLKDQILLKLTPEVTVREAARQMAARHVAAVVIAEPDNALDGIFTERDLVDRVVAIGLDPETTPLAQVMTSRPATISPAQTVRDALNVMDGRAVRHCVVIDQNRVVGIVSMRDFVGEEVAVLEHQHEIEQHFAEEMR